MPFQVKRIQVLLAKVETTEGTDATPAATDAVRLVEPGTVTYGAEEMNDRPDLHNQLLDEEGPIEPSAKYTEIAGKLHIRGGTGAWTSTTFPEPHAIIQGAGFAAAFAGGIWSYDTATTSLKSLTLKAWSGTDTGVHVLSTSLGARLSRLAMTWEAGKIGIMDFTARGIYVAPSDTSVIAPTYPFPTISGPRFVGSGGSWALGALTNAVLRSASVTIENTLVPRRNANAPDALAGYTVTQRKMTFSAKFEAARIADYDAFTNWVNAVYAALGVDAPGSGGSAGNKWHVDADNAVIMDAPTYEDDSGLILYGCSGKLSPKGTNRCKISTD